MCPLFILGRLFRCLNETIWSNKYLRNEAKVRIYKSIVHPILTYAAETRTDTAKTRQLLEVTEMNTLRRIINKTKWDRVRNDRIGELCGIKNITSWVQRRRTEWSKHVSRMADDRLVKKVHDGIPEWKEKPRSTDEKMERRTGINKPSAYTKRRSSEIRTKLIKCTVWAERNIL